MRIRETCGCGASIDVEDRGDWAIEAATGWRSNHKHDPRRPESPESDEQGRAGLIVPERDPRSTTDAWLDTAGPFGFNRRSEDVIA